MTAGPGTDMRADRFLYRTTRWIGALLALAAVAVPPGCGRGEERPLPVPVLEGYDAEGARAENAAPPTTQPNLVVIVIDTLRADAVTGRDGSPTRMPFLASL